MDDILAVVADIGPAQIIGDEDDDVGSFCCCCDCRCEKRGEGEGQCQCDYRRVAIFSGHLRISRQNMEARIFEARGIETR